MANGWLNPLNRIILQRAFKRKLAEVQINDGRIFTCDYSKQPGKVWVAPVGSNKVPCGWFDLDKVTRSEWLGTS